MVAEGEQCRLARIMIARRGDRSFLMAETKTNYDEGNSGSLAGTVNRRKGAWIAEPETV